MLSFASTPSTGTINTSQTSFTYTAGPFSQPNPSPLGLGQLDTGPRCDASAGFPCDTFDLVVNLPSGYLDNTTTGHPLASVKVTMSWVDAGAGKSDYDLYIYKLPRSDCFDTQGNPSSDCTNTDGNERADYQSASSNNPEVATISPLVADGANHHYTVHIVPYTPTGETVTVKVELLPGPAGGGGGGGGGVPFGSADATAPGVPRFMNFYAPDGTSAQSANGEFNIGFNPATKRIMTMNIGPIWRITPPEVLIPGAPECCEGLWEDKSNPTTNTGLDPILWTDQNLTTSRTFSSNSTAGANAVYGYSDNDGDTWTPIGIAAPNGGADHETIGTGNYPALLAALANPTVNRNHAAYYCSQDIVGPAACYRSDTLGVSWGASTLAYNGQGPGVPGGTCGGLHGHIHVAPDGTAWLPVNQCSGLQGGVFSTDGGTTWTTFQVPNGFSQQQGADPSIAIDHNNRIYYAYVRNEPVATGNPPEGHARVAVGDRNGTTINWLYDVDIGRTGAGTGTGGLPGGIVTNGDHGIINAAEIEAVGDSATPNSASLSSSVPGRAAVAFLGTSQPGDYQALSFPGDWYPFIATTYDGGQTWTMVNATPNDPVQHATGIWQQGGSATDRNLLDFTEITIDDRGRVLYGYSDGCVTTGCIAGTAPNDFVAYMRVARQTGGKSLLQTYDGSTDTTAAIAPKAPCLIGPSPSPAPNPHSTRDTGGSHLVWRAPDNGGADIIRYDIFRGTSAGGENLVTPIGSSTTTKFDDTTALPNVPDYFYVVKAINSVGPGPISNEIDLQVTTTVVQNICALPGVTLFTDPAGDSMAPAQTLFPATDLLAANVTQPYAPDGNIKLIFTINTTPEPTNVSSKTTGVAWFLAIKRADGTYTGVRMEGNPAGPNFFTYVPGANSSGGVDGRFVSSETQLTDGLSSYNPTTGVITIVAPLSQLGLTLGTQISLVSGSTATSDLLGLGAGVTEIVDSMPNSGAFTAVPAYSQVNANSVCAPNSPPTAALKAYPAGQPTLPPTVAPGGTITLDGSASSDPDAGDTIASYTFNFGDGSAPVTQSGATYNHVYSTSGQYGATLKVTDSRGLVSSNTALVDVYVNTPPTAALAANPTSGFAPLRVSFDASGSSDPDSGDTIASYTFRFGDGNSVTQSTATVLHQYTAPGTYTASLTVTDSRGKASTNTATKTITVNGQPDLIVSTLTASNNQAPQGSKVTFTATIKNQGTAGAGASTTQFKDGNTVLGSVSTAAIPANGSVTVTFNWYTASAKKGNHTITATADSTNVVAESNENNNTKTITISIQGNKT